MQLDGAIIPLNGLKNRHQRRKFQQQAVKVVEELEEVNAGFYWEVFNAPANVSYREIYIKYLNLWREAVNRLCNNRQFDSFAIDTLFFEREYSPKI